MFLGRLWGACLGVSNIKIFGTIRWPSTHKISSSGQGIYHGATTWITTSYSFGRVNVTATALGWKSQSIVTITVTALNSGEANQLLELQIGPFLNSFGNNRLNNVVAHGNLEPPPPLNLLMFMGFLFLRQDQRAPNPQSRPPRWERTRKMQEAVLPAQCSDGITQQSPKGYQTDGFQKQGILVPVCLVPVSVSL